MNLPLPATPGLTPEERARLVRDFETYRRELPRLLEEGHANRYAIIRDDQVVSIWDTAGDALQAGHLLFGTERFAVNKVNPLDVHRFAVLEAQAATLREATCP